MLHFQHMIFQPNNHSQWKIQYRLVDRGKAEDVKHIIDFFYDLKVENILNVEQVDETEINSNNFKIATDKGIYLLRRYIGVKDVKTIKETLKIIKKLSQKGVRTPQLVLSKNKQLFVGTDANPYTLFKFLDADHYRGTREEIESAGTEIGKLDKALAGLSITEEQQKRLSFGAKDKELRSYNPGVWKKIFQEARDQQKNNSKDQFHSELLAKEDFITKTVQDVVKQKPRNVSWGIVHFDIHPHNLLANGKEVVAIIDFDSLRYLEKMRALAFALHRIVRQYVIFNNLTDYSQAVSEANKIFLDAYCNVCEIDKKELATFAYFIKDEALSRLTFAMKDSYFNNNLKWRQDLFKQTSHIAEAVYFDHYFYQTN